jgi:hypothetical protein
MSDISDLQGVFATPIRWNAMEGILGIGRYDESTGERGIEEIELGSATSRFVMDYGCRERGYGLIRKSVYDVRLTPVNSPPPPWPDEEGFKPAVGCWLWNPAFGEVRFETNQVTVLRVVSAMWEECRTFKEASDGLQPVIGFTGKREVTYPTIDGVFFAPTTKIIGWVPRDQVPAFASREPTVKPPAAIANQVKFTSETAPHREAPVIVQHREAPAAAQSKTRVAGTPKRGFLEDLLDDEIPEL